MNNLFQIDTYKDYLGKKASLFPKKFMKNVMVVREVTNIKLLQILHDCLGFLSKVKKV